MFFKRSIFVVKWVESHPEYNYTAKVELYRKRDKAMNRVSELVEFTGSDVEHDSSRPEILSAVELSEIKF